MNSNKSTGPLDANYVANGNGDAGVREEAVQLLSNGDSSPGLRHSATIA